jgi:mRNA interferase MazF
VSESSAGSAFPRRFPRRGEIYDVDLGEPRGAVQAYKRPTLVVSNDVGNEHARTVIVAAITKKIPDKPPSVSVVIPAGVLPLQSTILCAHVFSVDKADLLRHRGDLDEADMRRVDAALAKALGLSLR